MKPPFSITNSIVNLSTNIVHIIGQIEGLSHSKPQINLRRENRIRTIHSSLMIEGNRLTLAQVTDIIDGEKVIGPQKDILEVQNAIKAYETISTFNPVSIRSLKKAHLLLMNGLIPDAGKFRNANVGVFSDKKVAHVAPKYTFVTQLMEDLVTYIKKETNIHPLILSSVFHYELEFIHPFMDGNGRLGRLWQTTMLFHWNSLFDYIPIEAITKDHQDQYYDCLGKCDRDGNSTLFIEFMLTQIYEALLELKQTIRPEKMHSHDRLESYLKIIGDQLFSRKDYLDYFKTISTATASRDLLQGVENGLISKIGDKAISKYKKTTK